MSICNSGGAKGADIQFGLSAHAAGHEVRHYSFEGHKIGGEFRVIISDDWLKMADQYIMRADKTLLRGFPRESGYINNLLRRNYFQVRDTRAVFAVAPLSKNKIQGGTAWAVQMAIDLRVPVIYVFAGAWFQWVYSMNHWDLVIPHEMKRPKDFTVYTGIGSRGLTIIGMNAIKDLYK